MRAAPVSSVLLPLLACACMGGPPDRHRGPPGFEGGPPGSGRLFISPHGQPFRGTPGAGSPLDAWFAQADANRDGTLTAAEFDADGIAFFRQVDANKDERVRALEVSTLRLALIGDEPMGFGGPGGPGGPGGGRGGPPPGGGRGGPPSGGSDDGPPSGGHRGGGHRGGPGGGARNASLLGEPEPVMAADRDLNSMVTPAEFATMSALRFGRLDTNKDGAITMAEITALIAPQDGRAPPP